MDRTGIGVYLHLVRSPDDPERRQRDTERADSTANGATWRKVLKTAGPEAWATAIADHMADGQARTFNRIMVEICDMTADVAFQTPPDEALWSLVAAGRLEHTTETPIYFRKRISA